MGIEEVRKRYRESDNKVKFIIAGTSWKKLILSTLFFIAVLLMIQGYMKDVEVCREFQSNPCIYLQNLSQKCISQGEVWKPDINLSTVNITVAQNEKQKTG